MDFPLLTTALKNQKKNVQKIIIDTDPGMDDAMAIMLALNEHKKGNVKVFHSNHRDKPFDVFRFGPTLSV